MTELERAVLIELEKLPEINHEQETSQNEKRLKKRTHDYLAKNLSRMTREAEQQRLRERS